VGLTVEGFIFPFVLLWRFFSCPILLFLPFFSSPFSHVRYSKCDPLGRGFQQMLVGCFLIEATLVLIVPFLHSPVGWYPCRTELPDPDPPPMSSFFSYRSNALSPSYPEMSSALIASPIPASFDSIPLGSSADSFFLSARAWYSPFTFPFFPGMDSVWKSGTRPMLTPQPSDPLFSLLSPLLWFFRLS